MIIKTMEVDVAFYLLTETTTHNNIINVTSLLTCDWLNTVGVSLVTKNSSSLTTLDDNSFTSESVGEGVPTVTHVVSCITLVSLGSTLDIVVSMETSTGLLSSAKNVSLVTNCLGVNDSQQLGVALATRVSLDQFTQDM